MSWRVGVAWLSLEGGEGKGAQAHEPRSATWSTTISRLQLVREYGDAAAPARFRELAALNQAAGAFFGAADALRGLGDAEEQAFRLRRWRQGPHDA
jgi:hypothetical protein